MPTTLEIVHWPANEAFAQDNTILKPVGDAITSFQGVQGVWYGQQVEETRVYIAVAWGTMDVHKAFVAGEGNIDKVRPALERMLAEGASRQMFHGQFDGEGMPFAVLSAPVTEIGIVTPMWAFRMHRGNTGEAVDIFVPWEDWGPGYSRLFTVKPLTYIGNPPHRSIAGERIALQASSKAGHEDVVKSILTKLTALLNESESPAIGGIFAPIVEKEGSYLLLIGWNSVEDKWAKSLQIMEELLGNAEVTLSHVKLLQHESV